MKKLLSILSSLVMSVSLSAADVPARELTFSDPMISIGVVVADLEKSVSFYTGVIGMKQTGTFQVPGEFATKLGLTEGVTLDVTVLRLEDSPDAPQWKLMSFGDRAKAQRSDHIDGYTGMQYITLNVADLTPFVQRLKQHGIPLLGETPIALGGDRDFVLIQDPDGTFIELIGPLK